MSDKLGDKPVKRVLMLCDFACATGFAQVAQNVVKQLVKETEIDYLIDIVAINYFGIPNEWQNMFPQIRLFPASILSNGDVFGRNAYLNMLATGVYDLTWILQDTFNIETMGETIQKIKAELMVKSGTNPNLKVFKLIFYYPIDAPVKKNWIDKSVAIADFPVVYTKYGYEESIIHNEGLRNKLRIIPHGIDEAAFRPLPKEEVEAFRKEFFQGLADDKFLVVNINRNQPRKDIARTLQVFAKFKQQVPEALLYLHMKNQDVAYTIDEVARLFDLIPEKDYIVPENFDEHDGFPVDVVNKIYNATDVIMSTTLGEGWGLSIIEAMATKTPVIAPNHTSLTEIMADGRGTLVSAGKTITDWFVMQSDNERIRPLVDVPEFVDKLVWLRNNKKEREEMAEKAYQFVLENWTWDIVGQQWRDVFKEATKIVEKLVKVGRNDPCPCGSGKKYKHCHGG